MDQISSYADEETYMLTTQQAKVEKDYTVVVSECVEEDFSDLEELQVRLPLFPKKNNVHKM